ncbi:MAG: hypothetical protein GNW80_10755 [Asgard group archaeon]|nr:hypothetical protein [Asgard group archaeon]
MRKKSVECYPSKEEEESEDEEKEIERDPDALQDPREFQIETDELSYD